MQSTIDSVGCPSACASRAATYWQFPVAEKYKIIFFLPAILLLGISFMPTRIKSRKEILPQNKHPFFQIFTQKVSFFKSCFFHPCSGMLEAPFRSGQG
ncbi:MAG: hypothetical protein ACLUE8_03955 [Lachnospiraceae bacterium]